MGDSPGAAAPAAASAEAEATLRTRAAAALVGSGSFSGAPAVGGALPSEDLATWARQVEAEFARVHARLDEAFADKSATNSSSREVAAACADQVHHPSPLRGEQLWSGSLPRRRRRSGTAAPKNTTYHRKHNLPPKWPHGTRARTICIIRGHTPPNLGDCPADLQSFVGEAIHVTANVACQLQCFSSFDIGAYGPRVDGPIGHLLMVTDRLDFLRLAVVAILSVGLSPGVADNLPGPAWVNTLGDAFTVAVLGLRAHTFSNYSNCPSQKRIQCCVI